MITMHEGGMMSPALVPLKIRNARMGARPPAGLPPEGHPPAPEIADESRADQSQYPILPLADLEAAAIRGAVSRFGGTAAGKQEAAKALGIGIATLYRKLRNIPGL